MFEHEQYVTKIINHIASLAMRESDHAIYQFVKWYMNEQVEEESSAGDILQRMKFIECNASILLEHDTELSTRVSSIRLPTPMRNRKEVF